MVASGFSPPAVPQPASRPKRVEAGAPALERLRSISDIMLFPSAVASALRALEYNFHLSNSAGLTSHILLVGPRSTGKRRLIEHFRSLHPPVAGEAYDEQPVLIASPTARTDARSLCEAILADAGWPRNLAMTAQKMPQLQVDFLLRKCATRMLVVNRADRLMQGGKSLSFEANVFLEDLMDRGTCRVVLVGAEGLLDAIDASSLAERFDVRLVLRGIPFDADWTRMLEALDKNLPFERTELRADEMPRRLHIASEGRLPLLFRLVQAAAKVAIFDKKSTSLDRQHFDVAFEQRTSGLVNPFGKNISVDAAAASRDHAPPSAYEAAVRANNRATG